MQNISYAGCSNLSWMVSVQFALKMCIAALNREQYYQNPYFCVSRSINTISVFFTPGKLVLVMIRRKSMFICNRSHARWENSCKITLSYGGTALWCFRQRGISSPRGTKLPHYKLETLGYHTVKVYLTWASFGTGSWHPRQTDRRTYRQTESP